jgi:hypothetical protein
MDVTPDGGTKLAYRANDIEEGTMHSGKVMGIAMDDPVVTTTSTANGTASIKYQNLVTGQAYQAVVALVDRSTGKVMARSDGKAISGTQSFQPTESDGSVDVEIQYGSDDAASTSNKALYVTLYDRDGKIVLAVDQDINKSVTSSSSGSGTTTTSSSKKTTSVSQNSIYATPKTGIESEDNHGFVLMIIGIFCAVAACGGAGFLYYRKKNMGHNKFHGYDEEFMTKE